MSEKDGTQVSLKQSRSRRSSKQNSQQVIEAPYPTNNDKEAWRVHWETQGQFWRTEPEIDTERQHYLAERRSIKPDIEQGIYPFKDIKLSRADVEWLLATHDNGKGPVEWRDVSQRKRTGLDLRGADLRRQDLQSLPLSRIYGGLTVKEWDDATLEQREMASVHLEGANLRYVDLEEASLRSAHFEGANLHWVHLDGASLHSAHFEGARLRRTSLRGAYLQQACLQGSDLYAAHLESANLTDAHFEGKLVSSSILADMRQWNTNFPAILPPTNLQLVFFDRETKLNGVTLGDEERGFVELADVSWGDVNLAVVDWWLVTMLGDERQACQDKTSDKEKQIRNYNKAVRSYRQLANALHDQGLNESSMNFAFRAQLLHRKVVWLLLFQANSFWKRVTRSGEYIFSWLLAILAGYGYKPERSLFAYIIVILGFTTAYFALGQKVGPPFSALGALVFSMTSFHGRGFFPGGIRLDDPITVLAALEALIGLIIEVSLIATFTKRFFGG